MGWMHESDTNFHEAALVAVFEDGAESHGSTMVDGVDYEIVGTGRHPDEDRLRPKTEIVGWLLSCDCRRGDSSEVSTWTDPVQWARVPSASLEDLTRHRVFARRGHGNRMGNDRVVMDRCGSGRVPARACGLCPGHRN